MTFESLYKKSGFKALTPIQKELKENLKPGLNIVGIAPTGTGKTHAFLFPILSYLDVKKEIIQVIIVVPTFELINQTYKFCNQLNSGFTIKCYDPKVNMDEEIVKLQNGKFPQIIIGTPSKISRISKSISLKTTKFLVLDEADMLFQDDFMKDIDSFYANLKNVTTILMSATYTKAMDPFIKKYFGRFKMIDTYSKHSTRIKNQLIKVTGKERIDFFYDVISTFEPFSAFVFVSNNQQLEDVYQAIRKKTKSVAMLSSNISLTDRKNTIAKVLKNEFQYLVTSDLGSRGLDFDVSHIINYDLPKNLEFFTHRIGRTGRMDRNGLTITFYDDKDKDNIAKLKKTIKFEEVVLTKDGLSLKRKREKKEEKQK